MPRDLTTLDNVYENNLGTLMELSDSTLPVHYPDSFFQELFPKGKNAKKDTFFAQLGYYSEIPVGGVKAKLIPNKKGDILPQGVYIEVLVVLDHYQGKGIGAKLLNFVETECKRHYQHDIFVHVACDNKAALSWYKKHGFEQQGDILKDYYKESEGSSDCFVLKKHIT